MAPKLPARLTRGAFHGFPRIDQLHERGRDGHQSENAQMNCIPASIAAGMEYLTGKPYSGDAVKEAVYGRSYEGPTQIYRYLDWVKSQGVRMRPVLSHDPEILVAELRKLLEQGTPAVISIPGNLNHLPADPMHPSAVTHVVIAAGFDENGNIRVMNPWGGVWLDGNDAFWASRICYGELWAMEPVRGEAPPAQVAGAQHGPRNVAQPSEPGRGRTPLRILRKAAPLAPRPVFTTVLAPEQP